MKKLLIPLVTLLIVSFILAGCSSNPTTPAATTPATKAPVTTSVAPPPPTTSAPAVSTAPPTTTAAPPPTTAAPSPSAGSPQSGGTLLMWITGDPASFWPPTMTGQTDGQTSSGFGNSF